MGDDEKINAWNHGEIFERVQIAKEREVGLSKDPRFNSTAPIQRDAERCPYKIWQLNFTKASHVHSPKNQHTCAHLLSACNSRATPAFLATKQRRPVS